MILNSFFLSYSKEYYYPYFDEYFDTLGGAGGSDRAASSIIAAAIASGYDVSQSNKRTDKTFFF